MEAADEQRSMHRDTIQPGDVARMNAVLERLDRRLDWIDAQAASPDWLPADLRPLLEPGDASIEGPANAESRPMSIDGAVARARRAMRCLYVTATFLGLPAVDRAHPEIQRRILAACDEIDSIVLEVTDALAALDDEECARVRGLLLEHPEIGDRLAALVEAPFHEDGLRGLPPIDARGLVERLRVQPPRLVIDPHVRKSRRIQALCAGGDDALLKGPWRLDPEDLAQTKAQLEALERAWERALAAPGEPPPPEHEVWPSPPPSQPPGDDGPPGGRRTAGQKVIRTGLIVMGIATVTTGTGLGLLQVAHHNDTAEGAGLVMGVTVGPPLLALGLLVTLIGGIVRLKEQHDERKRLRELANGD